MDRLCALFAVKMEHRWTQKKQKKASAAERRKTAFPNMSQCNIEGRRKEMVVAGLEGTLLRHDSAFPYYMLVAWEAPAGFLRCLALLVLSPLIYVTYHLLSEWAAISMLAFVTFAGTPEEDIASVARAVLPKFFADDINPHAWKTFSAFEQRILLTAYPRTMVEPFARQYLGVEEVLASELQFVGGYGRRRATGFFLPPGVLVGAAKAAALRSRFPQPYLLPDVAMGHLPSDHHFLTCCKEGYLVTPSKSTDLLPPPTLCRPLIFHDGRLVSRPTPFNALLLLLWLPFGLILTSLRCASCSLLPVTASPLFLKALGVRFVVKGNPPDSSAHTDSANDGVLFASTHRTLMDPVFIALVLGRRIPTVTFSLSRVNEWASPIPTVRLSRNREKDAAIIRNYLENGDLIICPEGTTCREPMLLRFSALFAELSSRIVPVATNCKVSMFHATTARGWKGLDTFYFFLNPSPCYEVIFLDELPPSQTCAGGKAPHEVANHVQSLLASTLGFKVTNFTRQEKYKTLLGQT
ncbi:hypothetical protein KP509_12G044300 [Ceratopteris richardii]|uniref:Phospholipid/glycerol acyltransferase domain-containing protein n=1 Tax=Ceratopteris richardii TaxID=49495 RepID=A0A8T2TLA4_CERRI|nr:hypothetical protein KP509_12G044300 [Ceratopteris richardii]